MLGVGLLLGARLVEGADPQHGSAGAVACPAGAKACPVGAGACPAGTVTGMW